MISFNDLIKSSNEFNKSESEEYSLYSQTINDLRKKFNTYRKTNYSNRGRYNVSARNNRNRPQTHKDSKLKSLLANSDKMINNFTSAVNKLNDNNYKIIYNDVVKLFTNYIGSFITDYVESYVKFGISGKCEIEDLNLATINEKYTHYQMELWKILIDKYINSRTNNLIYYKFISNLISWDTEVFNKTIISSIKAVFKTYCNYEYDIVHLDGVDDEDPEQFFKPSITELDERNTMIYNKIGEIITIFTEYNFSLIKIKESHTQFLTTINDYVNNCNSITEEPITEYKKLIQKYTRKDELGEKFGLLEYKYLVNTNNLDNINYILDNLLQFKDKSHNLTVMAYMIMGMLNNKDILTKILQVINKEELQEKIKKLSSKLAIQVKYKMMDIIDLL